MRATEIHRRPFSRPSPLVVAVIFGCLLAGEFLNPRTGWAEPGVSSGIPNGGLDSKPSPDGSLIAFLSGTLHSPANLWVIKADGTSPRQLTRYGVQVYFWDPDGKGITYLTRRFGEQQYWHVAVDRPFEETLSPEIGGAAVLPQWSPDGKVLAYLTRVGGSELCLKNRKGEVFCPTEKFPVRAFCWGPNSRELYFLVGRDYGKGILKVRLDDFSLVNIFNEYAGPPVFLQSLNRLVFAHPIGGGKFELYSVSPDGQDLKKFSVPHLDDLIFEPDPDGKSILFYSSGENPAESPASDEEKEAHEPHGQPRPPSAATTRLWRFEVETGTETALTPADVQLWGGQWFPGRKLLACSGLRPNCPGPELFVWDLAASSLTPLVKSVAAAFNPVPSTDVNRIAFLTNEGGENHLVIRNRKGETVFTTREIFLEPGSRIHWLPSDKRLVLIGDSAFQIVDVTGAKPPEPSATYRHILSGATSLTREEILFAARKDLNGLPSLYRIAVTETGTQEQPLTPLAPGPDGFKPELWPTFSFDGNWVAFVRQVDVWVMRRDGSLRRKITSFQEVNDQGTYTVASHPRFNPKGDLLTFAVTSFSKEKPVQQQWLAPFSGGAPRMLWEEPVESEFQVFRDRYTSPAIFDPWTGGLITTQALEGRPQIALRRLDAPREPKILTRGGGVLPSLLPDDGLILFTSLSNNRENILAVTPEGQEKAIWP